MTDDDLFDSACRNAGMRVTDCMDGPPAFRKAFMDAIAAAHARGVREGIEMAVRFIEENVTAPRLGKLPAALRALAAPETPP